MDLLPELGFRKYCAEFRTHGVCRFSNRKGRPCQYQHRPRPVCGAVDRFLVSEKLLGRGHDPGWVDEFLSDQTNLLNALHDFQLGYLCCPLDSAHWNIASPQLGFESWCPHFCELTNPAQETTSDRIRTSACVSYRSSSLQHSCVGQHRIWWPNKETLGAFLFQECLLAHGYTLQEAHWLLVEWTKYRPAIKKRRSPSERRDSRPSLPRRRRFPFSGAGS